MYDLGENSKLYNIAKETKKISIYGMRSAVIGGVLGEWKLISELKNEDLVNINCYFELDAFNSDQKESTVGVLKNKEWSGKGKLLLPSFTNFVNFLTSMIIDKVD
jgi:hypothetical protein